MLLSHCITKEALCQSFSVNHYSVIRKSLFISNTRWPNRTKLNISNVIAALIYLVNNRRKHNPGYTHEFLLQVSKSSFSKEQTTYWLLLTTTQVTGQKQPASQSAAAKQLLQIIDSRLFRLNIDEQSFLNFNNWHIVVHVQGDLLDCVTSTHTACVHRLTCRSCPVSQSVGGRGEQGSLW